MQDLRIGSLDEGLAGFSDIRGLVVDPKGNIWVLEHSTQDIRVFDPAGKHLRTTSRKGRGPGELIYGDGMALSPDGLVWVHDPQNGRFTIFDESGKFVRQQLAPSNGYGFVWTGGIDRRGRIWDGIFVHDPKNPYRQRLRRAAADWNRVDTLTVPACQTPGSKPEDGSFWKPIEGGPPGAARYSIQIPFYPRPVVAFDWSGGVLWCAPNGANYQLLKLGIERGDTLGRITGTASAVPVTPKERDSAIAEVRKFLERVDDLDQDWSRIPRIKPLIIGAFVDDQDRLWVRRSLSGPGSVFDIYSAQGSLLARVQFPQSVWPWVRPIVRGDTIWFTARDQDDVPYLVRGKIAPVR